MDNTSDTNTDAHSTAGPLSGLLQTLARIGRALIEAAHTRLELLSCDLQAEIQHAVTLLLWACVALLAAGIGLLFAAGAIILIFWDSHRLLAASLVTGVFFSVSCIAALVCRNKLRNRPNVLHNTLTELARDHERLKTE